MDGQYWCTVFQQIVELYNGVVVARSNFCSFGVV